jgi:hippurate hydrolase
VREFLRLHNAPNRKRGAFGVSRRCVWAGADFFDFRIKGRWQARRDAETSRATRSCATAIGRPMQIGCQFATTHPRTRWWCRLTQIHAGAAYKSLPRKPRCRVTVRRVLGTMPARFGAQRMKEIAPGMAATMALRSPSTRATIFTVLETSRAGRGLCDVAP